MSELIISYYAALSIAQLTVFTYGTLIFNPRIEQSGRNSNHLLKFKGRVIQFRVKIGLLSAKGE